MNKKNISPNPKQPVDRVSTGQLPNALAELTEATLSSDIHAQPSSYGMCWPCSVSSCELTCSYDGDDE